MAASDLISLQERIAHQEAAIDELTRHSLSQAASIRRLEKQVEQLQAQLHELAGRVGQEIEDAPPPHY